MILPSAILWYAINNIKIKWFVSMGHDYIVLLIICIVVM